MPTSMFLNNQLMTDEGVPAGPRKPLTGTVSIEWVDGADPTDASVPPNFGWFGVRTEPPMDDARFVLLLREIADSVEADSRNESA